MAESAIPSSHSAKAGFAEQCTPYTSQGWLLHSDKIGRLNQAGTVRRACQINQVPKPSSLEVSLIAFPPFGQLMFVLRPKYEVQSLDVSIFNFAFLIPQAITSNIHHPQHLNLGSWLQIETK